MGQTLFTVEIPVEVEVIVPVEKVRYVERFQTVEREVCFSNFVMSEFAYQSDSLLPYWHKHEKASTEC